MNFLLEGAALHLWHDGSRWEAFYSSAKPLLCVDTAVPIRTDPYGTVQEVPGIAIEEHATRRGYLAGEQQLYWHTKERFISAQCFRELFFSPICLVIL